MAINLQKGQRISLVKTAPDLEQLLCGVGWDVAQRLGGIRGLFIEQQDVDLDASVLCLNEQEQLAHDGDLIYFGNLRHASGAITHLGDHLTGGGQGDNEQILVTLSQIPPTIHTLIFVVNIYRCRDRQQDFSHIHNAFVRLVDLGTQTEIARYQLSGNQYRTMTGLKLAALHRVGESWELKALGEGMQVQGLKEIIQSYRP